MANLLKKFVDDFFMPELDWLQVEVTSYCNAHCFYCPHEIYRSTWRNRHIDLNVFKNLLPVLRYARLAFLQGWGEPFLHPDFFTLVSLAKRAGCLVGTTTNGVLVDAEMARKIVAGGMDVVSFSLAGTGPQNDIYRRGTTLAGVLRGIEALVAIREMSGVNKPAIHVSYLLLRSNLSELQRLPDLLADTAVSEVVISTLDFVPRKDLVGEAFLTKNIDELENVRSFLNGIVDRGRKIGLKIFFRLPGDAIRGSPCTENPLRAAFVSADGRVSPCVFTGIPVRELPGAEKPFVAFQQESFGNVAEESFSTIWRKREYRNFRDSLAAGRVESPCRYCMKLGESRL